jgi:hypothetical protein
VSATTGFDRGASLIGAAVFEPDPAEDFPIASASTDATLSGILHLAFGGIGFFSLAAAALLFARWLSGAASRRPPVVPGSPP